MNICTSRRAHPDKQNMRLVNALGQSGKYIWTEFRCPNVVDDSICEECKGKLPKYKYQSNQKCDHGVVGGPYPTDSKLYGSPFYEKQLKDGWFLKPEDELRAKEAVVKALSNMPRKKSVVTPVTMATPVPVATPLPVATPEPVPVKKEKKPRAKKVSAPVNTITIVQSPTIPKTTEQFVETMSPTLYVDEADIITVKVIKQKIDAKEYFLDKVSGKVYACLSNGVGEYKGRFVNDSLDTTYSDSDVE
jgi:hypothetical protein